jgi:ketosteroid isomerase-like protein
VLLCLIEAVFDFSVASLIPNLEVIMKVIQYTKTSIAGAVIGGCLVLLPSGTANAQKASSTEQAAIENALRKLDAEWSAAASARDLDKTVSYYSNDAVVLPPNAPLASTPMAIRAQWKKDIDSMIGGGWKPTRVEVAKSGDMAYVSGTYTFNFKDAGGKTVEDRGKYLEVWERQPDGSWKCSADAWNSDLPAAP